MPDGEVVRDSLERNRRRAADIIRLLSVYGYITDSYIILYDNPPILVGSDLKLSRMIKVIKAHAQSLDLPADLPLTPPEEEEEFFTDKLWESLPASWRPVLSDLSTPELANQLLCNGEPEEARYRSVWPLSLLALKAASHSLAFRRSPRCEEHSRNGKRPAEFQENRCQSSLLDPLFRKHVKPKKQHEIRQLGKLVKKVSDAAGCEQVVDIGSGQGHLSRFLAFGFGLSVTAVEADPHLVTMATKFDQDFLYTLKKERRRPTKSAGCEVRSVSSAKPPRHVVACVDPEASWEEFVSQIGGSVAVSEGKAAIRARTMSPDSGTCEGLSPETAASSGCCKKDAVKRPCCAASPSREDPGFVLTGLHACGDLSVAALRHFARCPGALGITSVACCYMKLSTADVPHPPGVLSLSGGSRGIQEFGYPMSSWVSDLPDHKLSYKCREVACHAVEDYIERLKGDSDVLRIHCYRAVLETVIRRVQPAMRRPGVQTIKKAHKLPFKAYAAEGLKRVGLDPDTPLDLAAAERMLSQQNKVVAFFSLALLLAPLVETLILLDRMIFLQEQGFHCDVIPLFKPEFSPRNLVLVAAKAPSDLGRLLKEVTASDSGT